MTAKGKSFISFIANNYGFRGQKYKYLRTAEVWPAIFSPDRESLMEFLP